MNSYITMADLLEVVAERLNPFDVAQQRIHSQAAHEVAHQGTARSGPDRTISRHLRVVPSKN
jgi:hypothetical protein